MSAANPNPARVEGRIVGLLAAFTRHWSVRLNPITPNAHIAAILIDLDGTLLHTAPDIAVAVNAVLRECGHAPIAESLVATFVGQGVDVLLHRALSGDRDGRIREADLQRARALFGPAYAAVNGRHATLYPGVVDGLDALHAQGLRLACVTNKPQIAAEDLLARFALDRYFACVVGGDTLAQRKPQPEPLWHAAALLGVPANACVALGDSANDAKAARAADMAVVLVDYGYTEGLPIDAIDCDAVVSSIVEFATSLIADPPRRFAFA